MRKGKPVTQRRCMHATVEIVSKLKQNAMRYNNAEKYASANANRRWLSDQMQRIMMKNADTLLNWERELYYG